MLPCSVEPEVVDLQTGHHIRKRTYRQAVFRHLVLVFFRGMIPAAVEDPHVPAAVSARIILADVCLVCLVELTEEIALDADPQVGRIEGSGPLEEHRTLAPVRVDVLLEVEPGHVAHADL